MPLAPPPTPERPPAPLVTQGARSFGIPLPRPSFEDWLRGGGSGSRGWDRIEGELWE
jgi:hypothetical protein